MTYCTSIPWLLFKLNYCFVLVQVAALAPLALLLVLEARCALSLWSSASLASTQHIYKLVSEHYPDCNGISSAHVQGRREKAAGFGFIAIRSM